MLSSVLHLPIEHVKELLVLHVINVGAPSVSELEQGIFQLFIVQLLLVPWRGIVLLRIIFLTLLLRLLLLLAVTVEVFSNNFG